MEKNIEDLIEPTRAGIDRVVELENVAGNRLSLLSFCEGVFVRKKGDCRPWLVGNSNRRTKEEKGLVTPLKRQGKEEEGSWLGFR